MARSTQFAVMISVEDASSAIGYYHEVFGATLVGPVLRTPDGAVAHAEMAFAGGRLTLVDAALGGASPAALGGASASLCLYFEDVDTAAERAVAAGAEILSPVRDHHLGYRAGRIRDPFGHEWILSEEIEQLSSEEKQARMTELLMAS